MRGTIRVESHYHYFTVAVSIVAVPTLAASALEWFSLTGKVGWSIDPRKGPPDSHLAAKQNTTSRASGIPCYTVRTAIIPSAALSARWLGWIVAGMQNDGDAVLSFFFFVCAVLYSTWYIRPFASCGRTYNTSWSSWLPRSPPSLGFPFPGSLGGVSGVVVVAILQQNRVLDPTVTRPGRAGRVRSTTYGTGLVLT